jgi:hypothetical protein
MPETLFPSILPGVDFVDDSYTKEELERMDRQELQRIAAESESEEVDGRMSNDEIISFFIGKERV